MMWSRFLCNGMFLILSMGCPALSPYTAFAQSSINYRVVPLIVPGNGLQPNDANNFLDVSNSDVLIVCDNGTYLATQKNGVVTVSGPIAPNIYVSNFSKISDNNYLINSGSGTSWLVHDINGRVTLTKNPGGVSGTLGNVVDVPEVGTILSNGSTLYLVHMVNDMVSIEHISVNGGIINSLDYVAGVGVLVATEDGVILAQFPNGNITLSKVGLDGDAINSFGNVPGMGVLITDQNDGLYMARIKNNSLTIDDQNITSGEETNLQDADALVMRGVGILTVLDSSLGLLHLSNDGGSFSEVSFGQNSPQVDDANTLPNSGMLLSTNEGIFYAHDVNDALKVDSIALPQNSSTDYIVTTLPKIQSYLIGADSGIFLVRPQSKTNSISTVLLNPISGIVPLDSTRALIYTDSSISLVNMNLSGFSINSFSLDEGLIANLSAAAGGSFDNPHAHFIGGNDLLMTLSNKLYLATQNPL